MGRFYRENCLSREAIGGFSWGRCSGVNLSLNSTTLGSVMLLGFGALMKDSIQRKFSSSNSS